MKKEGIDRVTRLALKSDGFTLIEVVLIIVMVSIFAAAIMLPFISSLRESDLPEVASIAYFLALEKLEELTPVTTGSISPEDWTTVTVGEVTLDRKVAVEDVNCDDLSTPKAGSGCRKITVTVRHIPKLPNGISVVGLRTAY